MSFLKIWFAWRQHSMFESFISFQINMWNIKVPWTQPELQRLVANEGQDSCKLSEDKNNFDNTQIVHLNVSRNREIKWSLASNVNGNFYRKVHKLDVIMTSSITLWRLALTQSEYRTSIPAQAVNGFVMIQSIYTPLEETRLIMEG